MATILSKILITARDKEQWCLEDNGADSKDAKRIAAYLHPDNNNPIVSCGIKYLGGFLAHYDCYN